MKALLFLIAAAAAAQTLPALPDAAKIASLEADMPYVTPGACTITATTSSEFTSALTSITSGGTICLAAQSTGAVFTGKFNATKTNAAFVTVRSTRAGELAAGRRIVPATDAPKLAKIVSSDNGQALFVTAQAAKWRFVGLEITTSNANHTVLVRFGSNGCVSGYCQNSVADAPQRMGLDRCWVHGLPIPNKTVQGVNVAADYVWIRDSVIEDIHSSSVGDTQAINIVEVAQGPVLVQNNKLEAAGENVLVGGTTNLAYASVPEDLVFRGNYFWKDPAKKGSNYPVKNDFELKTSRRVLLEGNVFENYWSGVSSQYFPIVWKTANQGGTNLGSFNQTADITFRYNKLINVAQGFVIGRVAASDNVQAGSRNFHVHDNLITGFGSGHTQDGAPKIIQWSYPEKLSDGTREYPLNVTFEHNTVASPSGFGVNSVRYIHLEGQGAYVRDFYFRSNVVSGNFFVSGSNNSESVISARFLSTFGFANNLVVGNKAAFSGNPNFQRSSYAGVFTNEAGGNYTLAAPSLYPGADGRAAGADMAKVDACTQGAVDGTWTGCTGQTAISVALTANGSAIPIAVSAGAAVTLGWSATGVTRCEARASNPYGMSIWSGSKSAAGGSEVIHPTASSTYHMDCSGAGGSVSASVTVTVSKVCAEPPL